LQRSRRTASDLLSNEFRRRALRTDPSPVLYIEDVGETADTDAGVRAHRWVKRHGDAVRLIYLQPI